MIQDEHNKAQSVEGEIQLNRPPPDHEPKPEGIDLKKMWELVRETQDIYRGARDHFESRSEELDAKATMLDEQEQSIAARDQNLKQRERELEEQSAARKKQESEACEREQGLSNRETNIRQREINAESGFAEQRTQMLLQLDDALDSFRSEFAKRRKAEEARFSERERELDDREGLLAAERIELASTKRKLQYEKEDLEEYRSNLDFRADQLAAAKREDCDRQINQLKERLEQAHRYGDEKDEMLRLREDADRRFGQRTPDEVLNEIDALRNENDKLNVQLVERPDQDAATRLANLERDREAWQAEQTELRRKLSEYKRRLNQRNIDATERESQRDLIESLKSQRRLLLSTHQDLRAEVDSLIDSNKSPTPFPACVAIDNDQDLQAKPRRQKESLELKAFVTELQHRIGTANPSNPLFYSLPNLRSFIGGLAMGRLILLQGISGTGKTSLPVAFAKAVGTRAAEIKVQAGWRDPQDLIGHYNAFDNRFHETEFLKALYRARTPKWRNTVQIVLLDEMNLSHPEQYFSDLLSTLELPKDRQSLELMTHTVANSPDLLSQDGRLAIPPNVWFVGTANHDETTMDFADKTYDRSHVMEFPTRPKPFTLEPVAHRRAVRFDNLQEAFDEATQSHGKCAKKAIAFLDGNVRESLEKNFEVGWGPRLESQIQRYVPVVVAAGGTVGEATDHMLTTRLLRKLRNRHDNRPKHLEELKQRIRESWPGLDRKHEPTKSISRLDSELRRLGQDPGKD